MKVGLSYDVIRFEEKALLHAANTQGHSVKPIHVVDREFWLNEVNGYDTDFIIQRCVSFNRALATTAVFEKNGCFVVNNLE
ncbi:MAG: hypothetical protein RMH74_07620, partial [Candidatus Caldarchaeum sp.]|nr:hypothetical protein [Candidatus Caldarchaeum sp.]